MFDPIIHHDSGAYLRGYNLILDTGDPFSSYAIFGRPIEVVFPFLYYLSSKVLQDLSQFGITILHILIFAFLYPIAVINFSKFLVVRKHIFLNQKAAFICFCLAICPIGLPLQLARQSIAFCISLIIISQILKKKQNFFSKIGRLLAIMVGHMFSVLNVFILSLKLQNRLLYLYIFSALISLFYFEILGVSFVKVLLQVQWRLNDEPVIYIYFLSMFTYLTIFLVVFLFSNRLSKRYLVFWISWLLITYTSIFIFKRLFFGYEFFFPVVLLFIEFKHIRLTEIYSNMTNRVVISKFNNQLIFTLAFSTLAAKSIFLVSKLI